jgi:hypothetical protein
VTHLEPVFIRKETAVFRPTLRFLKPGSDVSGRLRKPGSVFAAVTITGCIVVTIRLRIVSMFYCRNHHRVHCCRYSTAYRFNVLHLRALVCKAVMLRFVLSIKWYFNVALRHRHFAHPQCVIDTIYRER